MPSDSSSDPKLEIAHVLAIDLVGYSNLLINEQSRIIAELNRAVRDSVRFQQAEAENKLLRLPTGDGMVLVFFQDPEGPIECAMEISAAIESRGQIPLRMGIHSGPVNQIVDVNDRSNIAGAGIDIAQRVMDCGDAGHILLSKRVAEDLAPFPRWNPHLHDLGECEVKHGRRISLVNFYTGQVGNPAPPEKCRAPKRKLVFRTVSGEKEALFPRTPVFIGAAILLALAVVTGLWIFSRHTANKRAGDVRQTNSKSIAVLPFENLSGDPGNAYFADGIQEEILTRLSKISELKVISRTSTQRYKSTPENLREIAQQLSVAHVLEGSVQKAADQVRVNVQLINAENDSHVWAEKFDRKLTDIFAVESEIASKIAQTLQAKLTGAEQHAIASRPTENSEAHQLYLKGRYYWNKWLGPGFEKSRDYYQQAIDLDPTYALAYAGLADYYGFAFAMGLLPPEEKWAKAEEDTASKALELDPTLGEAYNPLAAAKLYYHRDWPAAENYFHRGLELSPNFAEMHHHYALCLVLFGRNEEALAEAQRALELDPLSPRFNWNLGRLLFFIRQYDRAVDQYRKTLELEPNNAAAHEWLGFACEKKGMQKEAIAEWSRALTLSGEEEQASILQRTYATSGFGAAVRALAQKRLEWLNERTGRGEYVAAVEFVIAYTRLDDKEQAFGWLAKAVKERNRLAFEIKVNPICDPLRSDPRFDRLLEKVFGAAKDTSSSQIQSKTIAVLPFENLSRDPDNAYFAEGPIRTDPALEPLLSDPRFEKLANQIVP
jgi:adenylate cyclase